MKTRFLGMFVPVIALVFYGLLRAEEVSHVYYHVGVNEAAPGEGQPQVNVFSPDGGIVGFRFVDFQGNEWVQSVSFEDQKSQRLFFSDLVPDLAPDLYFLEISGPEMAIFLDGDQNAGAGFTPVIDMCSVQGIAMERSATSDDYFRIYSEQDAVVGLFNEDRGRIETWHVPGGIPVVFPAPNGPNTSYVLKSDVPFVASFHDAPIGTLVLQCVY